MDIELIPPEIMSMILDYLDLESLMKLALAFQDVSHYTLVCLRIPTKWEKYHFDITNAYKGIDMRCTDYIIQYNKSRSKYNKSKSKCKKYKTKYQEYKTKYKKSKSNGKRSSKKCCCDSSDSSDSTDSIDSCSNYGRQSHDSWYDD